MALPVLWQVSTVRCLTGNCASLLLCLPDVVRRRKGSGKTCADTDPYFAVLASGVREVPKLDMSHIILIADDSPFIREALCNLFEREEAFDVCGEPENGRGAVHTAQELHPDLILLDLLMPVMNGLDTTCALKRVMPEVPVIMYSAYSDCSTEKEARSAGVSTLVSRSEHISVLLSKVRGALEPQQLRAFQPLSGASRQW